MSRIGRTPITVPAGVTVKLDGQQISVKGPKGELTRRVHPAIRVQLAGDQLTVARPSDEQKHKALHGLSRSLLFNMVEGTAKGFQRILEIQGVGYKAEVRGTAVNLVVGYSHPVLYQAPPGIKISVENNTVVKIDGADKEMVGQVASEIRAVRPPEPYKGKGIRYRGEQVRRKAGKAGKTGAK